MWVEVHLRTVVTGKSLPDLDMCTHTGQFLPMPHQPACIIAEIYSRKAEVYTRSNSTVMGPRSNLEVMAIVTSIMSPAIA
jgi:hypothetical protein